MADRTPEDIASGIIRVSVGGVERELPTLPIRATREWQALLTERLGGFGVVMADEQSPESLNRFASLSLDTILDLVTAYDRTGALGGRDWLEDHADPAQLYAAVRLMASVSFPFVPDLRLVMAAIPGVLVPVARSGSASSTNGRSPSGVSTPGRSKTASTRSS